MSEAPLGLVTFATLLVIFAVVFTAVFVVVYKVALSYFLNR